jgi:hypothetical protein
MDDSRAPLWHGNHVSVKQLAEYFAKYLYLPCLRDIKALLGTVAGGVATLNPTAEGFGYADGYDEALVREFAQVISDVVRDACHQSSSGFEQTLRTIAPSVEAYNPLHDSQRLAPNNASLDA